MSNKRLLVIDRLTEIFRSVFDDDDLQISEATSAADIEDWDSLAQINLILAIESVFKLRFTPAEIEPLKNIGGMVDLVLLKIDYEK